MKPKRASRELALALDKVPNRSPDPAGRPAYVVLEASLVSRRIPHGVEHRPEQRRAIDVREVGDFNGRENQHVAIDRDRLPSMPPMSMYMSATPVSVSETGTFAQIDAWSLASETSPLFPTPRAAVSGYSVGVGNLPQAVNKSRGRSQDERTLQE